MRRVPSGRVVSYGQVAALAGRPGSARQVGYAMAALPAESDVPWHRVVNARGRVSRRTVDAGPAEGYQRHLLEEEGVDFRPDGSIDLDRFRWEPGEV